jgi:thiol:disulfide interchange protein
MHEQMAINNADTFRTIRANGVTILRADATNLDPAVMQLMKDKGLNSLLAFLIYSPAVPNEPIILKDLVSQRELLETIRCNSERSIRN